MGFFNFLSNASAFLNSLSEEPYQEFHGVPLSELSKLAKEEAMRGEYCSIQDEHLILHYHSNRGKPMQRRLTFDDKKKKFIPSGYYYANQYYSPEDDFIKLANEKFSFV